MPGHDDHDLERRLREQRPVARDEFVEGLAAKTRSSRSHPSARPRLTLAFALSLALLVSLVAFGGVGAAKNAVSSSASSVRSAWGDNGHKKHHGKGDDNDGNGSPAHHQYHGKVQICFPKTKYVVTYHYITVTKTVYKVKWHWVKRKHHGHWVKVKIPVVITYQKKVRERVKTIVYREKTVRAEQGSVPRLQGRRVPGPGRWLLHPRPSGDQLNLIDPD